MQSACWAIRFASASFYIIHNACLRNCWRSVHGWSSKPRP